MDVAEHGRAGICRVAPAMEPRAREFPSRLLRHGSLQPPFFHLGSPALPRRGRSTGSTAGAAALRLLRAFWRSANVWLCHRSGNERTVRRRSGRSTHGVTETRGRNHKPGWPAGWRGVLLRGTKRAAHRERGTLLSLHVSRARFLVEFARPTYGRDHSVAPDSSRYQPEPDRLLGA